MATLNDTKTETIEESGTAAIEKFRELVEDIPVAMFITSSGDGWLDGRPMGAQELDDDGALWFFTDKRTGKVAELQADAKTSVSYVDSKKATYVFARGITTVIDDKAKAEELWSAPMNAWFEGADDPNLVLLRVDVDTVEFWNDPAGGLVSILRVGAKALGANVSQGEMGHLEPS